jgi:hypothetical protein
MRKINDKLSLDRVARQGSAKADLERGRPRDDPLEVARHLYYAMCVRCPDRSITLFDSQARMLARCDRLGRA